MPPCGCDIAGPAWHDSYVPVLFLIAIVVVLVGIFFAATGRGGQLAYEPADHAPLDLGPVSAADIALLRPPTAMWGYNMQVTDAALDQISRAMRERDVTIAYLQEQITSLARGGTYAEPRGAHARLGAGGPLAPGAPEIPPYPGATWAADDTSPAEPTDTLPPAPDTEPLEAAAEIPTDPEIPVPPETLAEAGTEARTEAAAQAAAPPRTPLVLKASAAAKAPPAPEPEPHEATQPNEALQDPERSESREDPEGPQGAFDTHGWWAEQKAAAREEAAEPGAGPGTEDDPLAAAEEQSW